ncbi:MAG: histidine kinase [Candidatus Pedobacter colombiensis]|uniref:Histidine kinase n=1 Tax=Candidatus Pedobacter colombiensis TaxID=3121371 RepID=A0AAJ5W8B9_9SPHI|nr:sensor histidine kinase [Pedobacter sp.]WEK19926.1 MAG: histidine kinase [Pedobacter sp.]
MKFPIYSSRYFIIIGIFMFLCFAGIWFFMSGKLSKRTEQISIELATKIYQLKSNIMHNEFEGFTKGINDSETILPEIHSKNDFIAHERMVEALLLSHPKINKGWYAIASKNDTIYKAIQKKGNAYNHTPILKDQKNWVQNQLLHKDTTGTNGALISVTDTLHWLIASRHKLADSSVLMFGLDINLKELQRYLWSVDTVGRAYAFITDEKGYYVTNPVEKLIGTKMLVPVSHSSGKTLLADSISSYEIVTSSYLQLPVVRYYTPLNIASMKWTMVIDTPVLAVDEDVKIIEKYMMIMFISAALIILLLISWSQAKWQKEFMLRQQLEMNRKELSLEKQALSLIAERQQKENALLQLNTLKEKVNPHFLFNSLSSLNALIEKDPELAQSFVVKLSRVYRYVLESYPNGLATVAEELRFVNEYFFLLKIRFGDALEPLELRISDVHLQEHIPFMSLQTLIENAVKHNMLSKEKPLKINIESVDDYIVVTNNLQLRSDVRDSSKQGLNYLQSTYAYFGTGQLRYGVEGQLYKCYLPVLQLPEA